MTISSAGALSVLIVEDLEDDARLIAHALKHAGYDVAWERVETADQMRAALGKCSWDLVLADFNLPKFSGVEALRVLQAAGLDIPLILISGTVGEETAVDAMLAGARDFVVKGSLARLVPAVQRETAEALQRRQRRQLEETLRGEQNRFRALVEKSSEVILVIDREGVVTYESPSALRIFGYPPQERVGQKAFDFVHPDDVAQLEADFAELLLQPGATRLREFRYRHKDGRWRWLEGVATNLLHDPHIRGFVANIRDVSERKQVELAFEESRQRLQAILEHSPALIYMTDVKGNYIVANRLFEQKFSPSGQRVLGRNIHDIFPKEVAEARRAHDFAVLNADAAVTREETIDEPDGRHTYLTLKFPLHGSSGVVQGICGISTDITERKALETQFLHAQKMEAFGQLAGGIAHDFNNILTAVLIQFNLLGSLPQMPAQVAAALKEMEDDIMRASGLTRQLLLFSRRQVVQMKPLDLNQLLGSLIKMLRRLLGEHVELLYRGEGPAPWIHADSGMIEQIVVNLSVNARDAMPRGGRLDIRTSIVDAAEADPPTGETAARFVCLEVSDTGCGMDQATLKRVFEPFFTTKEVGKGTGLGLATVYGIVKQHHGWIRVDSEVGKGTTFHIYFPLLSERSLPQVEVPTEMKGGTERILLVEDDPGIRKLIATCLSGFGYRVTEASDGPDALAKYKAAGDFDLLFTDMVMPGGMSGRDLADNLLPPSDRLRVIITTGHTDEATALTAANADRITLLPKPFEVASLLEAVRRALRR